MSLIATLNSMATSLLTSRVLGGAAKLRLAASSVASVASGYERGWAGFESVSELRAAARASDARFSQPENAICSQGGR
jgi:hypothetical protein